MPDEARRAISAGYGDRLMLDWWFLPHPQGKIFVLSPLGGNSHGQICDDGDLAGMILGTWTKGGCTLHEKGLCAIHNSGFKPYECRVTFACNDDDTDYHKEVAMAWNTPKARAIVDSWCAMRNVVKPLL